MAAEYWLTDVRTELDYEIDGDVRSYCKECAEKKHAELGKRFRLSVDFSPEGGYIECDTCGQVLCLPCTGEPEHPDGYDGPCGLNEFAEHGKWPPQFRSLREFKEVFETITWLAKVDI